MNSFLFIWLAQTGALISPGATVAAIAAKALEVSRKDAIIMAAGVALGSAFWASIALLGTGVFIAQNTRAMQILEFFGALYFAYLAFKAFRNLKGQLNVEASHKRGKFASFFEGIVIQLSNPKTVFFWMAIGSGAFRLSPPQGVLLAACFFALINSFFINSLYALLFSSRPMLLAYEQYQVWFRLFFAVLFSILSLFMFAILLQ